MKTNTQAGAHSQMVTLKYYLQPHTVKHFDIHNPNETNCILHVEMLPHMHGIIVKSLKAFLCISSG